MWPTLSKRSRLLEFSLAVALIAVFGGYLLRALSDLQDEGERLAVELTIRNLNSSLFLLQAERLAAGREQTLGELARQNPVTWLQSEPAGYIGEHHCPQVLAPGQWCWNPERKALYYAPRQENWIKSGPKMPWLTWRVASPEHTGVFRPGNFRLLADTAAVP